jgi:hypothetical protein
MPTGNARALRLSFASLDVPGRICGCDSTPSV